MRQYWRPSYRIDRATGWKVRRVTESTHAGRLLEESVQIAANSFLFFETYFIGSILVSIIQIFILWDIILPDDKRQILHKGMVKQEKQHNISRFPITDSTARLGSEAPLIALFTHYLSLMFQV